jgi:O-antigen/teichoic acid export membrane protein
MFKLKLDMLLSLFLKVAFAVLSLLTISFLSGAMLKNEFGAYSYYFSIYSLCLIPFTVGFSRFNVRFLASIDSNLRTSEAVSIFKAEVKILAVMILFSLCVFLLLLSFLSFSEVLIIFLIVIPFVAVKNVIVSLYRGMGRTFYGNFDGLFAFPLLFLAVLYLSHEFLNIELTASYNVLVFFTLSIVMTLIFYVSKLFQFKLNNNCSVFKLDKKVLTSIALFTLIGALDVLNTHLDITILGSLSTVSEVAEYKVSSTLKSVVLLPMQSFMLFIPFLFSKYYANTNLVILQKNIHYLVILNVVACACFLVVYVFWGGQIIHLLFSDEYLQVKSIAMILIVSVFISSLFGPSIELLIASGHEKLVFKLVFGIMFITTVGNLSITVKYGALGVAIMSALSIITLSILGCYFAYRKVRLNTSVFGLCTIFFVKGFRGHDS